MKKIFSLAIIALLVIAPLISNAQDSTKSRMERRKEMKEKYDNMTPEQKAKVDEKRKAAKEKYDNMTPEQKKATKEKLKAMRNKRKENKE